MCGCLAPLKSVACARMVLWSASGNCSFCKGKVAKTKSVSADCAKNSKTFAAMLLMAVATFQRFAESSQHPLPVARSLVQEEVAGLEVDDQCEPNSEQCAIIALQIHGAKLAAGVPVQAIDAPPPSTTPLSPIGILCQEHIHPRLHWAPLSLDEFYEERRLRSCPVSMIVADTSSEESVANHARRAGKSTAPYQRRCCSFCLRQSRSQRAVRCSLKPQDPRGTSRARATLVHTFIRPRAARTVWSAPSATDAPRGN